MAGIPITDHQFRLYMKHRKSGDTQAVAASKAGFSESTARRHEQAARLPSQKKHPRKYRTRKDPFDEVWLGDIVPLLERVPSIRATSVLEALQRLYPERFPDRMLRTLQRRITHWRATQGPQRELIFRQDHPPGRQGLSDFTDGGKLNVSIAGEAFPHLLYHFRLAYSGWEHAKAICGGESFTALAEGLQEALWQVGGAPLEHRTDSLSAAYKNRAKNNDTVKVYEDFCRHYGMRETRNNKGVAHENGSIEAAHGPLRRSLSEALVMRGSHDFADLAAYQAFIQDIVARKNARRRDLVKVELKALRPLPVHRTTDYSTASVTVTSSGVMSVRNTTYSVPSRLVGTRLKVHIYDDRLVCFLGATQVLACARVYAEPNKRGRCIDYRHLIHSLVRKPQAFRNFIFKEELFPQPPYRRAWAALNAGLDPRQACRVYVGLLHIAAKGDCETDLAQEVQRILDAGQLPELKSLRSAFAPVVHERPEVSVPPPDLAAYDALLTQLTTTTKH